MGPNIFNKQPTEHNHIHQKTTAYSMKALFLVLLIEQMTIEQICIEKTTIDQLFSVKLTFVQLVFVLLSIV